MIEPCDFDGKRVYFSERAANLAADSARARTGHDDIDSYFCFEHGGFHIGHLNRDLKPPNRRSKKNSLNTRRRRGR